MTKACKYSGWILAGLMYCLNLTASNSTGDAYMNSGNYWKASEAYQKVIERYGGSASSLSKQKLAYAQYRLSECYAWLNQPKEAAEAASEAIINGCEYPEAYLIYGKSLQKIGEYDRAKAAFDEYGRLRPGDKRTANLKASCDFAKRHSSQIPIAPEENLQKLNTNGREYGINFYQNGMLYSSSDYNGKRTITHSYYADNNDNFQSPRPIDNMVKERRGQNAGTFAVDTVHQVLYYTRCLSNAENNCFIYHAVYKNNQWRDKGVLPIGNRHTNAAQPALSADGERLYFVSDKEGGQGGWDIWYLERKDNGRWNTEPINVGNVVNTPGNELFPNPIGNTLIFASDNQIGFGGYDLYSAQIQGNSFSNVLNLMRPINSSHDDINLIVSEKDDEAFLCSSRLPQKNDDIFRFKGVFSSQMLSGHVYNKATEEPLADAQVIINGMGKSQSVVTDEEGYYYAFIDAGDYYKLQASSIGFLPDMAMIKAEKTALGSFPVEQDFYLSQSAMSISGRVYDLETNEPFINEDVLLIGADGTTLQQTKTDITGRYLFTDLQSGKEYQVKVSKPNFLSISSKPFIYREGDGDNSHFDLASLPYNNEDALHNGYESDYGANNRTGNGAAGREISLNEIYYNFDSAVLTSESEATLSRIVLLLNSNPGLKLEFASHTDLRGSDAYNDRLSDDRAHAVVNYLVKEGINRDRLSWKGYGKRYPVVKNAVTETEHRLNRRTTLRILAN